MLKDMGMKARQYMEDRSFESAYLDLWKSYSDPSGYKGDDKLPKAA
jgi:hypothetical protein